jgi:hypothetical protein
MTQVCCPRCQLRFTGELAASLTVCPQCGEPPQRVDHAAQVMGFRLHSGRHQLPDALLAAVAAAKRDLHKTPPALPNA